MKPRFITQLTLTLVLGSFSLANAADWATLKGQFVYGKEGTKVPTAPKLAVTKDPQVCGKHALFNEQLLVNEDNRGVANVVLWAFKPKAINESYKESESKTVELDNKDCRFAPHVVTVRTGQKLIVKNSDPIGHNSLIGFLKNPQINPIIPANGSAPVDLTKPEIIPVKVSCSIHPWMQGIVVVQDHPYMAVTDADGKFELANLPAGDLTLKVWHENSGWVKSFDVDGKGTKLGRAGKYKINLTGGKDEEHTYTLDPKMFNQ